MEISGSYLHWWSRTRQGWVPLVDLRSLRPSNPGSGLHLLKTTGEVIPVWAKPGVPKFAEALHLAAPQMDIKIGRMAYLVPDMRQRR